MHSKINSFIFKFLQKLLLSRGYYGIDDDLTLSFAQSGEDSILRSFFINKENGFYVDVGAYHPKRYSNTYIFYLKGWRGINIDANPGSMKLFEKYRSKDINLELGIGTRKGKKMFYTFAEPAFNTFSKGILRYRQNRLRRKNRKIPVQIYPLADVLDKYLPQNNEIDFLSIDVEGMDMDVLRSNNWKKYRPKIIIIEDLLFLPEHSTKSTIYTYLHSLGYTLVAYTTLSLFFKDTTIQKV